MFGDTEYYLRRTAPGLVEIAKFEGTKAPVAVYEVELKRKGPKCSCPASRRGLECKHLGLVRTFLERN